MRVTRDVPEAVDDALTRALARTPVDRFATAAQFVEALRQVNGVGGSAQATVRERSDAARRRAARKAIAVLPLANMSADPENEYFSDGMTEEIINALAKVPGMQVASRTSSFAFKGKEVDVRQIGEKLGVTSVLEGSVRKVGNRVRITAQLISVADGYHLWSETYDRQLEDVFAIQDEISHAIVDALKLRLGDEGGQLVAPTKNIEAYTLYLKGRFVFNKDTEPVHPEGAGVLPAVAAAGPGLRPVVRRHRGLLDPAGRRFRRAGRRLPPGQGGGDPGAAARPRPGRGDHVAGQGAVLVRVGLRRRRAAAPPGRRR